MWDGLQILVQWATNVVLFSTDWHLFMRSRQSLVYKTVYLNVPDILMISCSL